MLAEFRVLRLPAAQQRSTPARDWMRALEATARIGEEPTRTLPVVIGELAQRFGDKPALLSNRETMSFRALAQRINRYARWALAQGIGPGAPVCLLMPNRPEYLAIWLGVTKVGGVVALLNTNLTGAALAHCIAVAAPGHIIVAAELAVAYAQAAPRLAAPPKVWLHGEAALPATRIDHPSTRWRATNSHPANGARPISPIALFASTPRAPPACRRRPMSAITAS